MNSLQKMKGGWQSPPKVGPLEILWSWIGSFAGITVIMLLVALIVNNIPATRKYPEFWLQEGASATCPSDVQVPRPSAVVFRLCLSSPATTVPT